MFNQVTMVDDQLKPATISDQRDLYIVIDQKNLLCIKRGPLSDIV